MQRTYGRWRRCSFHRKYCARQCSCLGRLRRYSVTGSPLAGSATSKRPITMIDTATLRISSVLSRPDGSPQHRWMQDRVHH